MTTDLELRFEKAKFPDGWMPFEPVPLQTIPGVGSFGCPGQIIFAFYGPDGRPTGDSMMYLRNQSFPGIVFAAKINSSDTVESFENRIRNEFRERAAALESRR